MEIPSVILNSGHKMPAIGLGTGSPSLPSQLVPLLIDAIAAGYRHIDTASFYQSEEHVGLAAAKALESGLIKSRQQLFITSKLWCTDTHPDLVLPALKNTLRKLGLQYVDLYLIHWPVRYTNDGDALTMLNFDIKETWEAMGECCRLGLAKSIGVSNFSCAKLAKLLENATIPPAVNQVEMNVGWQQQKLMQFCKEKNIHVCAFSPLGAHGTSWGSNAVMESPILKDIGATKNKALPQIALRWIYEQGASPIVRSFNKERMKQNLDIFDWELKDEEIRKIQEIPQQRACNGKEFVGPNSQYKSFEELWDGEI